MLRIVHLEEIEGLLLQLSGLVQQQETRNPDFFPRVRDWLAALEGRLAANRLAQAGALAALRSSMIAAEHGQLPEAKFRGRPTRSRMLNAVASQSLQRAVELASPIISENRTRIAEGERIARQLVAALISRGLVIARANDQENTQYLRGLRQTLASSADLETVAVHVEGLVGPYDFLVLLDRLLAAHPQAPT